MRRKNDPAARFSLSPETRSRNTFKQILKEQWYIKLYLWLISKLKGGRGTYVEE